MKTKLMFLLIGVAALSLSATVANNRFPGLPVTEQYGIGTSRFGNTPLFWHAYIIPTGRHPAVLVIHIGGFREGKPGPASVAQDLNAAGFNVFAIEYRLAPPHTDMPRQVAGDDGH